MTQRFLFWTCLCTCAITSTSRADHLPPIDPIGLYEDHSHENHAGHHEMHFLAEGSNLSFTNFSDAIFDTTLTRTNVTGAVFDRASFRKVDAVETVFLDSSLRDVYWPTGHIANTTVSTTDFTGSYFSGGTFRDVDLHQAIMQQTDLSLVGFHNVEFNDTDLRGANLSGANLRTANLATVIVDATTTYDRFTKFPDGFDPDAAGMTKTDPQVSDDLIKGLVGGFVIDGRWHGMAYEAASNSLLLVNNTNSVFRYSLTGEPIESIEVPFNRVAGLDVLPNGQWLLASDREERLGVYSVDSDELVSDAHFEFDEFEGIAYDSHRGTVFITEDDGKLMEVALDGTIVDCCFGTAEHENLGFDPQTNRLIALNYALDSLNEKGEVVDSVAIHEFGFLPYARSITLDPSNRRLYALYSDGEALYSDGNSTPVRILDMRVVPEPSTALLLVVAFAGWLNYARRTYRGTASKNWT